jgi:hypothetical protein
MVKGPRGRIRIHDRNSPRCVCHEMHILNPHPLLPLTFNPLNNDHLREVEECNELPMGVITKARWIKLEYKRTPKQRSAHAIFAINDINITNNCIRDSIYVCRLQIWPSQLKHKPMQCMKCRHWGHFAYMCTVTVDTCGTCRGEHRSNKCANKEKTYCISCKSDVHASWDRDFLEFHWRCEQYDENYPENNLPYFPTEETWTLTPCPGRYQ